jgi:Na+/H+ antiporter NhaD/arsenite permease-like protein
VANVGGALTPLGDPPLFLGFLHGVPFFWVTLAILPHMLVVTALVLATFWLMDSRLFRKEPGPRPEKPEGGDEKLRIEGAHNLLLLLAVMGAVLFSGTYKLGEIRLTSHVSVAIENLLRDAALILVGLISLRTTSKATRERNGFSWGPIQEVAYLFAGIFMTIVPALKILLAGEHGALAGLIRAVHEPVHYFWASGSLSSFLDNAPTYLTFFNTALGSLGATESAVPGMLGHLGAELRNPQFVEILKAVSAGSVFMGANTYIGNAPNFMVKSIAEEAGVPMPSFFGYMFRYSIPILIPSFIVVSLLFFR